MEATLLSTGLVCLLAAIVGGGLKGLGFEFPALSSTRRQVILGMLGLFLVAYSQRSVIADLLGTTSAAELPAHSITSDAQEPWPYFLPCDAGTRNVFVASGYHEFKEALAKIDSLRRKAPQFRYKLWKTVAKDGRNNIQFAIVVGHGLAQREAKILVERVKVSGVAVDSYYTVQEWSAECSDLSRIES